MAATVIAVVIAAAAAVVVAVGARRGRAGGAIVGAVPAAIAGGVGGAGRAVTMGDGECLPSFSVGVMLKAEFFEKEEGAGALEGVRRVLGGDDRLDVPKTRAEAAEEVQHHAWFRDRMADVAQLIGEAFELGAIVIDGHVTLHQGTQFGLQLYGALHLIVLEEAGDGVPEGERVVAVVADGVEDALGDGGEDPVDDA